MQKLIELTEAQAKTLAGMGVSTPTEVQRLGVPAVLEGRHVLLHAPTGTGKTLAYLLPLLARLERDPELRAVVIAPGVELAMQTHRVALALKNPELSMSSAVSTSNPKRQKKRLTKSTRLFIGTPDRVGELFKAGKLKGVALLVLDELEPLLQSSHSDFLQDWLVRSTPAVQVVVASATLGPRSEAFARNFMADALTVEPTADVPPITHCSVFVPPTRARDMVLCRFLDNEPCRRAILFVADAQEQRHLERVLLDQGKRVISVVREESKQRRQANLNAFRTSEAAYLVTTDAVARGLDMPEVDWVINVSFPKTTPAYVHRAGRTGRAGRPGTSVVLVAKEELGRLGRLSKELAVTFDQRG